MKRLRIVFAICLFALAGCGAPETRQAPTQLPEVKPTWTPRPSATVAPTSVPTATPEPTAAPTQLPIATYTAELSATVAASLPPTPADPSEPSIAGAVALPLHAKSGPPLWAVFSYGMHSFSTPQKHFVAIYARLGDAWQQLSKLELENPDYVDPTGVRQVDLAPDYVWLEVQSGVGAHGGCYDILRFDGKGLQDAVSHCGESPGAGSIQDVNGDGTDDVVLDQTDSYIFCYACGVRLVNQRVLSWDGQKLAPVELSKLPDQAPANLRDLNDRAVELAKHGLWMDAQATVDQMAQLGAHDPAADWNAALIRLTAKGRAEQAQSGAYPLLDNLFYGEYAGALDVMRKYSPEQIFAADTPLVKGTTAESWEQQVTDEITQTTDLALQLKPDLAAAYFLRGWAVHLTNPASPSALPDVERAAQLAPDEKLFTESLAYLKKK